MYTRFGKMQKRDYIVAWIEMVLLLIMGTAGFFFQAPTWYSMLLLALPLFWGLGIYRSFQEKFTLEADRIVIHSRKNERTVALPDELVIVLSEMDMHEKMGSFSLGGEKQYFATLATDTSGSEIWQILHKKKLKKYAASIIDNKLTYEYLYSFVCDKALLRQIVKGRRCYVIMPASLKPIFYDMLNSRETVEVRVDPYY